MQAKALYQRYLLPCWSSLHGYNPIEVSHTEGCYLYTKDGRKIFDLGSAHECINIGYNHPDVLAAMRVQMDKCVYVTDDFATEATSLLAEKLCNLVPLARTLNVFGSGKSGAASVEAAIKAARFYKYRQVFHENRSAYDATSYPYPYKIISRYRSWHGSTARALSVSGDPRRWFSEPIVQPGVIFGPDVYPYRSPFGDDPDGLQSAAYLRYMIEMEGGREYVAAIIVEPVVGSNGIIPAPKPYMKAVRDLCNEFDLLLIVDETMTGMGRTGKLLAIEHYDVVPDIVILGKALGVYCPLSACVFSEKVWKTFESTPFGHGQSYSGHALGCAAALASLNVIEDDRLLEHVQTIEPYLQNQLQSLKDRHISVGDVRGMGMMWTLELVLNRELQVPIRKPNEKYKDNPIRELAAFMLHKKNVYIPADKFGVWITPPLIATRSEIDMLIEALDEALLITDHYARVFNENSEN